MDETKQLRGSYRGTFTKFTEKIDEFLKSETGDSDSCSSLIAQLEEKYDKIRTCNKNILDILLKDEKRTEKILNAEIADVDKYEERYIDLKTKLGRRLTKLDCSNETLFESENNGIKRNFKLPKIELQKFDGNLKDWLAFWELFKKIDKDPDLSAEDKFQYLIQSTVKGSRAREVVESFPPTANNYQQAVQCLQSRFGKEDVLVEVYVRELLTLVLNNALDKEHKMPLVKLYDRLETQLRSLKILGVTSDKYSSMLYPLVESCLSINLLRVWERHISMVSEDKDFNKLDALMKFLRNEIDGEEKINLAKSGFGLETKIKQTSKFSPNRNKFVPTGMELFNNVENKRPMKDSQCVFCEKSHSSSDCRYAQNLSHDQRKQILVKKGGCFRCLRPNHIASLCRVKDGGCKFCGKSHHTILCYRVEKQSSQTNPKVNHDERDTPQDETLANVSSSPEVMLQTLAVILKNGDKKRKLRVIIDSASQRSYILSKVAEEIGYNSHGKEILKHSLFGGTCTDAYEHDVYKAHLSSLNGSYCCNFDVLSHPLICKTRPKVAPKIPREELANNGIYLSDLDEGPIELLIGADVAGKLLTGGYKRLPSGLAAIETKLGWTVMGRCNSESSNSTDLIVTSMLIKNIPISNLWDLDVIGIKDAAEKKSRKEQEAAAYEHFLKTIKKLPDGRYEVSLPWLEGHQPLENNRFSAEKRLKVTVKSLQSKNLLKNYEDVFAEWLSEGIIEKIDISKLNESNCLYLPHRAIVKEHSTTKLRPVFDASARQRNCPSLNDCLEKGLNLVEEIPSILTRFRWKKYGVTSDIKKAFLQISLNESDRDYLRFLWLKGGDPENLEIYRHKRVVFGINASPFLLGATISYHLENVPIYQRETAEKLKRSMYVDNCVTSLDSKEELEHFIEQSKQIMSAAQFDLRGWRYNETKSDQTNYGKVHKEEKSEEKVLVLGLEWNTTEDTLCCILKEDVLALSLPISKRSILSTANQIFDPLGILCPITLPFKILMQECWKAKLSWDTELPDEISKKYVKLKRELGRLKEIQVPRKLCPYFDTESKLSLHVFCDASLTSYATCIYLRCENGKEVTCQLVQARSRVAPLKSITISRLELLACCIGARLMNSVKRDSDFEDVPVFFWTDSMNALYWIKNDEPWGVFVMNRVNEIRTLTNKNDWNHVPGTSNPADIPSRGCTAEKLIVKKWHDGPDWLKYKKEFWPSKSIDPDKEIINSEKKKTIISSLTVPAEELAYLTQISNFEKIVRVTAWMKRFIDNCRIKIKNLRKFEAIKTEELKEAELTVWKMVQRSSFNPVDDVRLRPLCPFTDPLGIIRTKTRLIMREDSEDFKCPIILPSEHPVVMNLIMHKHILSSHCGIQTMMSILREDFWILKTRRTIRKALRNCILCKRFKAKHPEVYAAPLPRDRIRDAAVFEVTGIDLAGPLFLRDGTKAWIVLFTCAVYRAIHLELVSSLSTDKFLMSLRRFISRRGRPLIIYTDNGSNFTGSNLALKSIDWEQVVKDTSISRITWKFIPPGSPWWGGFWERMVGLTKNILRKVLGKSSLKFEELITVLCDCENVINARPITYISEDLELEPLTPAMFLRDIKEGGVPDLDYIDAKRLQKRILYRMKMCDDLRKRFRSEYLGQLRNYGNKLKYYHHISVGDIVLIKTSDKRINWPLAKIIEIYPGKDGIIRLVQVKTKSGSFLRPVQSIYPLELTSPMGKEIREIVVTEKDLPEPNDDNLTDCLPKLSKYGRQIRVPQRLDL